MCEIDLRTLHMINLERLKKLSSGTKFCKISKVISMFLTYFTSKHFLPANKKFAKTQNKKTRIMP